MIDFHSHILPGIDDGSRNAAISAAMLEEESAQGVDTVIATPHFYAGKDSVGDFLQRRQKAFEQVREFEDRPRILLGAEVYYFEHIGDAAMVPSLCVEGTSLLLLEMPFCQWTMEFYKDVEKLIRQQNLVVVLAHIERFEKFQKNKDVWSAVMKLPLYVQMNAGAFLDWKRCRRAVRLMKEMGPVLLGSDCHNIDSRRPNLAGGRAVISGKMGSMSLMESDLLAKALLL